MSPTGTLNQQSRLSDDDRYELASIAQNQQRLNYPQHLILIGIVLVVVSIVALIAGWQSRSGAQKQNIKQANDLVAIENTISQIIALQQAQENDPGQDLLQPIPDMFSRLERYATQAKLESKLVLPKGNSNQTRSRPIAGNATQKIYPYTIKDPSLEHLLDWIEISTGQIPGLEVRDIEIQPAKNDWTMKVTLSRYERNE